MPPMKAIVSCGPKARVAALDDATKEKLEEFLEVSLVKSTFS